MITVPFHKYESTVRFFEEAADDPAVTHLKIVQYRVARKSRIMKAIMRAVAAGKQVSGSSSRLGPGLTRKPTCAGEKSWERAGVTVHYSFRGVKVHSKLALVRRNEPGGAQLYAYLSTGNFHEDTAKIYSDFGLFTSDHRLTGEVARVFSFLETVKVPDQPFEHLMVGQFNLREGLENLIDYEIAEARAGRPAGITLKMNSLQDWQMIDKLYEASRAGVPINMIIRGICCLIPGLPGVSSKISTPSVSWIVTWSTPACSCSVTAARRKSTLVRPTL